jgi:FlaA1/EpsC-like NDP-sugar epimerase
MYSTLAILGRSSPLFDEDMELYEKEISSIVSSSKFLVIGGAGSIGSAVVKELFSRSPRVLHIVDISENNMVELVRDLRSSLGYFDGEFATFAIDCGSDIFDAFINNGTAYDYIFNFSALKHVRSEKDPYTLMRMIDTNIFNTDKIMLKARETGAKKYFCVSTDKAANPVSMMGATKTIMEMFLMRRSIEMQISSARFANVAFSDGSLLYGFNRRIEKEQPITAPNDLRRYFVTQKESGELCMMACLLGSSRDIFFPKLDSNLNLITFSQIAERYLANLGYEPVQCTTEDEARDHIRDLKKQGKYPVYFFKSDTTGEKEYEEFYTDKETLDLTRFKTIGIIKNDSGFDEEKLNLFTETITQLRKNGKWDRSDLIELFNKVIVGFGHKETGKFLDAKM